MNFRENIREGVKSIKSNSLRTLLTAAIIAIGIASLIGILTAIDGIQASINDSFANLGANSFKITSIKNRSNRRMGVINSPTESLKWEEVQQFKSNFEDGGSMTSLFAWLTFAAELKYESTTTDPNIRVKGGDENLLFVENLDINKGRNFSTLEIENGLNVILLGSEVATTLFRSGVDPVNKTIMLLGTKLRVVGALEQQGGLGGDSGADRTVIIPINTARRLSKNELSYEVSSLIRFDGSIERAMGEATGLMRKIRRDGVGESNSFEVSRNVSLAERLGEMSGYLRIGGFSIGLVTLVGASIALMNIMMVSVTERTREIGVRKALGATPKKIRFQFLIEALLICQVGGVGGIVIGMVLGNIVTLIVGGSFVIPWLWTLVAIILGIIVGVISGYLPASRASRLDPIESLRFE